MVRQLNHDIQVIGKFRIPWGWYFQQMRRRILNEVRHAKSSMHAVFIGNIIRRTIVLKQIRNEDRDEGKQYVWVIRATTDS